MDILNECLLKFQNFSWHIALGQFGKNLKPESRIELLQSQILVLLYTSIIFTVLNTKYLIPLKNDSWEKLNTTTCHACKQSWIQNLTIVLLDFSTRISFRIFLCHDLIYYQTILVNLFICILCTDFYVLQCIDAAFFVFALFCFVLILFIFFGFSNAQGKLNL